MGSTAHLAHLVRRFLGSLSPHPLAAVDDSWARQHLLPGEVALWSAMSRNDRKHAVGVARAVVADLGAGADRPVVAAALLHDVGKIDAGLGTTGRVAATVLAGALGRERARSWAGRPGPLGRVGRYLRHDAVGAELLREAGSDPLTVAWAAEHHLPSSTWTVPSTAGDALRAADDD